MSIQIKINDGYLANPEYPFIHMAFFFDDLLNSKLEESNLELRPVGARVAINIKETLSS